MSVVQRNLFGQKPLPPHVINPFSADSTLPLSRNTDPGTSHAAERKMRDSGALAGQQQIVYDLIAGHPEGLTAPEIAQLANFRERTGDRTVNPAFRRAADLKNKHLTHTLGMRKIGGRDYQIHRLGPDPNGCPEGDDGEFADDDPDVV